MNVWVSIIEFFFGFGLFFNAALFVPQARQIIKKKSAENLSWVTFLGFNMMQIFTLLHAYIHRDYLLFIGFFLSFLTCGWVTILIFKYQNHRP